MMGNPGSPSMESPFTTLLAPPPSASTPSFTLAVLPRSTPWHPSTLSAFLAVAFQQVETTSENSIYFTCIRKIAVNINSFDHCNFSVSSSLGLGATLNVAKPTKGSTVAVFGLGAVGLAVSVILFPFFLLSL